MAEIPGNEQTSVVTVSQRHGDGWGAGDGWGVGDGCGPDDGAGRRDAGDCSAAGVAAG